MKKRAAFTMIELVFVIVVIGILAAIAIPRIIVSRDDAVIANARAQFASIQSGITTAYNDNLMGGAPGYPATLEDAGESLFANVMTIPIRDAGAGKNGWHKAGANYVFTHDRQNATFTYDANTGSLSCIGDLCDHITR